MSISFNYDEKPSKEIYGNSHAGEGKDFSSMKELKIYIRSMFKSYTCPNCGGHKIDGDKIIVEIGKIRFFKEVEKKGFFGIKYTNKHDGDIYRVFNIHLKPSGFLSFAGYIRCNSCKWEQKGKKGVRWVSVHDALNGKY